MTITPEQLDELERTLRHDLAGTGLYGSGHRDAVTLQLVAIARAALLVDTAIPDTLHEVQAHRMLRKAIRGEQ